MSNDPQYVTFGIAREIFAIPVAAVQEILDLAPIARLPQVPDFLLGLMDVRGAGVPVVDLRARIGLPRQEPTLQTRVLIVELPNGGSSKVGLVADRVIEVTSLEGADLDVPPGVGSRWRSDCVSGIGRRGEAFVIILKLVELLDAEELSFAQLQSKAAA